MHDRYHQLQLHLLCAQVAFQCRCLGQAEASIEAILDIMKGFLRDKPDYSTLSSLTSDFIPSFMSYMLVVPCLGEKASSFAITKMLKTILGVPAELLAITSPADQLVLGLLYVKGIQLMITASSTRDSYPYHIGKYRLLAFLTKKCGHSLYVFQGESCRMTLCGTTTTLMSI